MTPEKLEALEKKHESLFEVELKNIKFFFDQKIQLIRFVEHCIEALYFLYMMWYTHEGIDTRLYKGIEYQTSSFECQACPSLCEIVQVSVVTAATHTLTVGTTKFSHPESTRVTVLPYNQVKFYHTTTATYDTE